MCSATCRDRARVEPSRIHTGWLIGCEWFEVIALGVFVKVICLIIASSAWCGAAWIYVRAVKQARAAGYEAWNFDLRAPLAMWRGRTLPLYLMCVAIFAAAILAMLVFH
jgi:hypothetical protein